MAPAQSRVRRWRGLRPEARFTHGAKGTDLTAAQGPRRKQSRPFLPHLDRGGPIQAPYRPGDFLDRKRRASRYSEPDKQADPHHPRRRRDMGTRNHARAAARGHRQGKGGGQIQRPYADCFAPGGGDQAAARRRNAARSHSPPARDCTVQRLSRAGGIRPERDGHCHHARRRCGEAGSPRSHLLAMRAPRDAIDSPVLAELGPGYAMPESLAALTAGCPQRAERLPRCRANFPQLPKLF